MSCTGVTAFWCPDCGDCTCQRSPDGECYFDDPSCLLHSHESHHAEDTSGFEKRIADMKALAGDLELGERDAAELAKFAALLTEKAKARVAS